MTIEEGREYIDRAIKWALKHRRRLYYAWGIRRKDDGCIWKPERRPGKREEKNKPFCMCPMAMVILYAQNVEKMKLCKNNPRSAAAAALHVRPEYIDNFINGFDGSNDENKQTWYSLGKEFETKYQSKIQTFP